MNSQNPPTKRLAARLQARLCELGYNISPEWSQIYAQLFQEYLLTTLEGKEYIVDLFKLDWSTGESDQEYHIVDTGIVVPGEEIYFLKAAVVRGQFVPPSHVDEYQIVTEKCDQCGVFVHCLTDVKTEKICGHCLLHMEEHRHLSDRRCSTCTVSKCPNHPLHIHIKK